MGVRVSLHLIIDSHRGAVSLDSHDGQMEAHSGSDLIQIRPAIAPDEVLAWAEWSLSSLSTCTPKIGPSSGREKIKLTGRVPVKLPKMMPVLNGYLLAGRQSIQCKEKTSWHASLQQQNQKEVWPTGLALWIDLKHRVAMLSQGSQGSPEETRCVSTTDSPAYMCCKDVSSSTWENRVCFWCHAKDCCMLSIGVM